MSLRVKSSKKKLYSPVLQIIVCLKGLYKLYSIRYPPFPDPLFERKFPPPNKKKKRGKMEETSERATEEGDFSQDRQTTIDVV